MKTPLILISISALILNSLRLDAKEPTNVVTRNSISINLITPFDPYIPRIRAGYSFSFAESWQIGTEIGYGDLNIFSFMEESEQVFINEGYQLWEIHLEMKYVIKTTHYVKPYFAGEIFYIHQAELLYEGEYILKDDLLINYQQTDYLGQKYGIDLKTGLMISVSNYIALEPYIGFGLRTRINTFSDTLGAQVEPNDYYYFDPIIANPWYAYTTGIDYNINFTIGFRLNILF